MDKVPLLPSSFLKTLMDNLYLYKAKITRVIDGDTLEACCDVGFYASVQVRFRLMGYNAPETKGVEKPLGIRAKHRLEELAHVSPQVYIKTYKGDAFGRWLADIQLFNGEDLVTKLIAEGFGVAWDGKGGRPAFDPEGYYPPPKLGL